MSSGRKLLLGRRMMMVETRGTKTRTNERLRIRKSWRMTAPGMRRRNIAELRKTRAQAKVRRRAARMRLLNRCPKSRRGGNGSYSTPKCLFISVVPMLIYGAISIVMIRRQAEIQV